MPTINVKLCKSCMKRLLEVNPYVDPEGKHISYTGIKLKQVSTEFCDHRFNGKCKHDAIVLTPMRCCNCAKEMYIRVDVGKKPTCPSCRSMHMEPIKL